MAVDVWPAGVPICFSFETLVSGIGNGLMRSSMDTGPAKVRRRSTAVSKPLNGSLVMDYSQLKILEDFITGPLLGGALPFSFPDHRGYTVLVRFTGDGDLLPWRRFGAGKVVVDLKLEILPGSIFQPTPMPIEHGTFTLAGQDVPLVPPP